MLCDTPEAARTTREGMAALFGTTPEFIGHSPMVLIGTPEDVVTELRRREKLWEVRELVFQFQDESMVKRFAQTVIPALRR
jgi:hypothetical protein